MAKEIPYVTISTAGSAALENLKYLKLSEKDARVLIWYLMNRFSIESITIKKEESDA